MKRSSSRSKKMSGPGTGTITQSYDDVKQEESTARRQTAQFQNSSSASRGQNQKVPNVNLVPLLQKKQDLQDKYAEICASNQPNALVKSIGSTLTMEKRSQHVSSTVRSQSQQKPSIAAAKKKRNLSNLKNCHNNISSSRTKPNNHKPQNS